MKNGKKITAAISASAVVAAMAAPVVASASTVTFTDINGNFAQAAIQKLADAGIVHGTDGKFNPNGTINKQDFVIILVNALGLDVSSAPATPSFSDVPATSYAYKYVEAAKKAGIVHGDENGKFGYNTNLQRQQMALMFANAAGADVTGKASKNNFSDNSKIGSWAADAVGYAVEQGWIHGFDGKFDPTGSATRAQVAVVASAFLDTVNANKDYKIVASATSTVVGQKVTLSVPGATNVVWSVDKNGVIDASGNFVGTAVGTATVTATVNGKTLTQAISVAGAAATVKVSAPTDMVANNVSEQTITVSAVDANGNVDTTFNGDVTVDVDDTTAADFAPVADQADDFVAAGTSGTLTLTNGVGTFVVKANEVPGVSSVFTVTFNNTADNTVNTAQATVNTVEQVATSISLDPTYNKISVNDSLKDIVNVDVLDQAGQPMVTGSYPVNVTIAGAGTFDSGSTDAFDTTYTASGVSLPVNVWSIKGQTGTITVTATSEGLKTATATIGAVVAQDASKLTLANASDTNTTNTFAQGSGVLEFTAATTDANGYSTGLVDTLNTSVKVYAYKADGSVATNLSFDAADPANGTPMTKDGIALSSIQDVDGHFFVTDADDADANAGKYTIVIKDTNTDATVKTLTASPTLNLNETADAASSYTLSSASTVVASQTPTTSVTVQVTDTHGNPVAKAGEHFKFHAQATSSNTGTAQFNGGILKDTPETTVVTDATGKATVTFTAQPYDGDSWDLSVLDTDNAYAGLVGQDAATVAVAAVPAAKTSISVVDTGSSKYANSSAYATAGDSLDFTVGLKDQFGKAATQNDTLKVVLTAGVDVSALTEGTDFSYDANNNVVITGDATTVDTALDQVVAAKAGLVTATVSDLSNTSVASSTATFHVVAGDFLDYKLADSTGASTVTVASNTPVQLTLFAADAYGNRVSAPVQMGNAPYHISFLDAVNADTNVGTDGGDFRLTANGASLNSTGLDLAAGATKTIYYVNSVAGTYDLTASKN